MKRIIEEAQHPSEAALYEAAIMCDKTGRSMEFFKGRFGLFKKPMSRQQLLRLLQCTPIDTCLSRAREISRDGNFPDLSHIPYDESDPAPKDLKTYFHQQAVNARSLQHYFVLFATYDEIHGPWKQIVYRAADAFIKALPIVIERMPAQSDDFNSTCFFTSPAVTNRQRKAVRTLLENAFK